MTLERSHGKPRIARTRLRDVSAAAVGERQSDRDSLGRFAPGNGAGRNRTAKRSLTATLRAAVAQALAGVAGGVASPQTGAQIARDALSLYRAGARELGTDSAIARSHLVRWAVNSALASHLVAVASEAPDTERSLRILERAHICGGHAERASVAALTFARAFPAGAGTPTLDPAEREYRRLRAQQTDDGGEPCP